MGYDSYGHMDVRIVRLMLTYLYHLFLLHNEHLFTEITGIAFVASWEQVMRCVCVNERQTRRRATMIHATSARSVMMKIISFWVQI